ncbi:amino acid permease [Sphingobacterium sp. E70]|uniref:amino acid permease n=1 Tax=Sphingobacterium sp. E70 TaxID=2853439 RepID=UPI00211C7F17|nr:amino acid permease [Sphingobacterium sp. E70]ULT22543.1 amino acid permease [Sphingobacterium sp. E70]
MGIAAIVGAGIFSTIGLASYEGGPAVSLLFIFTAFACVFTALAYAQFASTVPVSGSAYTYAYVAFGELFAWIIGWALVLEYAVSNTVIAISWSQYFVSMLEGFGLHIPAWLSMAPGYAYDAVDKMNQHGMSSLTAIDQHGLAAFNSAPRIGECLLYLIYPRGNYLFGHLARLYRY